jgi:hypothetical protein
MNAAHSVDRSSIAPANSYTPYGCIYNLRSKSKALNARSLARIRPIDLLGYEPDHSCDGRPRPDFCRRDRSPLNPNAGRPAEAGRHYR